MRSSVADIGKAAEASVTGESYGDLIISGVSIDSRKIVPGDLFVCIRGEKFDGHAFASAALESGAAAIMIDRPLPTEVAARILESAPLLQVNDSVAALGRLAARWREKTKAFVIGVTGTAGKTTVKEVLAQVLERKGKVAKNDLNLNNQIGMPLSILKADGDEDFWVMEAGISKPEDMDELGAILLPDLALVLNAGAGHLAGLGNKGSAHYKARFLAHLSSKGTGLVCADYPELAKEARGVCRNMIFFSAMNKPVFYRAAFNGPGKPGHSLYRLVLDGNFLDVHTPFNGHYGAENTIAIAAAAHLCGVGLEDISAGFAGARLPKQRCQISTEGGWRVIDDSYNANPLSMARMLEAASEMAGAQPMVCMLGEMGELGEAAREEHEKLGRLLGRLRPKAVFWKGRHFDSVSNGLRIEGAACHTAQAESPYDFCGRLAALGLKSGLIIIKGSRMNALEHHVAALKTFLSGIDENSADLPSGPGRNCAVKLERKADVL